MQLFLNPFKVGNLFFFDDSPPPAPPSDNYFLSSVHVQDVWGLFPTFLIHFLCEADFAGPFFVRNFFKVKHFDVFIKISHLLARKASVNGLGCIFITFPSPKSVSHSVRRDRYEEVAVGGGGDHSNY